MKRLFLRLCCLLGLHDWDGHTEPEYPAPRCRRCGRWYGPRNVVQKNIVTKGDVCAGNIYKYRSAPSDTRPEKQNETKETK